MADGAAQAVVGGVYGDVRSIFCYISKKFDYANDFEVNFEKMNEQATRLYARRNDVVAEVSQNPMKRATDECAGWIKSVEKAEREVLELTKKHAKEIGHARRFLRFWPRANLSKRMDKKGEELRVLQEEFKLDNGVLAERSPEPVRVIYAPRTENKPSLHGAVEEILGYLRERSVTKIGLWGMVGTGKTTVMQNLNNNEEVKKMFDIVIWVSVSKAESIEKVQDAIMQRLKLKVEGGVSPIESARLISRELGRMRYLLLLDDVCDDFDLHQIGIHKNDKDSKVVFASRSRALCRIMGVDELVEMKRLSDGDAYKMFEEKVGKSMENPSIIPIAQLVIKECAGLPLVINKVAKVFGENGDNIHAWRADLRSLQRCSSTITQAMDEVLNCLKFCYDHLKREDRKVCFLYGALFPEDHDIFVDYLMECWKVEGFLQSFDGFGEARDRGHKILEDLVNVSLLEKSATKRHVRMNKVLRNMALKIASGGPDYKLLARTREKECPREEEWASANRISLMGNDLSNLPATPNCTNLSTLLLQKNRNLMVIPDSFFSFMERLRLLDLHCTGIASLPRSLSRLTDLRALYLNSCTHLTELPSSLEALVHLEVLDIRRTGIRSLPIQVGCLTKMRCLRMSWSNFGTGLRFSISSFSSLEELVIEVDPNTLWFDQVVRTVTEEVSALTRLTLLTFSFPKVECLEIFVGSSPLWRDLRFTFQFSVGICSSVKYHLLDHFECQLCKCLKYANDEGVHPVISQVLAETDVFELIDHKNISSLSDFGTQNMSRLRACLVEGCEDMICIIDVNLAPPPVFEWLERMVIKNAPSLHCFWQGPVAVPVGFFGQMTSLSFYNCPKLRKIFSNGLLEQLSKLEHLSVKECCQIEEIIIETDIPCLDSTILPRLKILVLHDLPKLRSFAPDTLTWPSLKSVDIASCPSLLKIPSI